MHIKVSVEIDKAHNEMYVGFLGLPAGGLSYSIRVADSLYLDIDELGRIVGIQFTDLEKAFGVKPQGFTIYGPLVGVKEAAAILGVKKPNFLRDYVSKPGFPAPVSELASGRVWSLKDVMAFAKEKNLKKTETLSHLLMVYLEANEMTVGAFAEELGLEYKGVLRLLQDHTRIDELTPRALSRKHRIEYERALRLLTQLRGLKVIGRSVKHQG